MKASELMAQYLTDLESGTRPTFFYFGDEALDREVDGVEPGSLVMIAGESGKGKTSYALYLATQAAEKAGTRVLYLSFEMDKREDIHRVLSCLTGVSSSAIAHMRLTDSEKAEIVKASARWSEGEFPLSIVSALDDKGVVDLDRIDKAIEKVQPQLVFLDNLNHVIEGTGQHFEKYNSTLKRLKSMAAAHKCVIACLVQIRHQSNLINKTDFDYTDLMGSSAVVQDASLILALKKADEPLEDRPWLVDFAATVLKNRKGTSGGKLRYRFRPATNQFYGFSGETSAVYGDMRLYDQMHRRDFVPQDSFPYRYQEA